jgi:hypothetical protein
MGSFLASIFGGSNPTLSSDQGQLGSLGSFSSNTGQNDTTAASNYYSNILSGNPTQIAESLAPEISANSQQAQQQKQTLGQFGGRSGGNTATANNIDTQSRANITNLIGGEQNKAASAEAGLGTTETGQAAGDINSQANLSQEALMNAMKSIFGQGIGSGVGSLEGAGLSSLGI